MQAQYDGDPHPATHVTHCAKPHTKIEVKLSIRHEKIKELGTVPLLETIAVETEQALKAISVALASILNSKAAELVKHLAVEVIAQEERPEAEESVHFGRLADTQALALCARVKIIDRSS